MAVEAVECDGIVGGTCVENTRNYDGRRLRGLLIGKCIRAGLVQRSCVGRGDFLESTVARPIGVVVDVGLVVRTHYPGGMGTGGLRFGGARSTRKVEEG